MKASRVMIMAAGLAMPICLAMPVLVSACKREGTPPRTVQLGETFSLAIEESAELEARGLRVTFQDVLSDSRCPSDAVCVWAGEATVALEVVSGDRRDVVALSMYAGAPATIEIHGYQVTAVELAPYPVSEHVIERSEYRLAMTIEHSLP